MAIIKKFSPFQNLSSFSSFINDTNPNSQYFRISEFGEQFTGGKNGFLIEGSEFLKEGTEVKIEILDVDGNPIYFEPGEGVPEYYEGTSKLVSVHVYEDTPIGIGKITVLGELKTYLGTEGEILEIPEEWKGVYNVKWEKEFKINKNLSNENIVRFYKRPLVSITELVKPIFTKTIPSITKTGYVHGISEVPPSGTDISNWRAGTNYKLQLTSGSWDRDVDENSITISSPTHNAKIIEVINDTEVLVDVPYSSNNIVSNFTSGSYSITYSDFNNQTIGESTLTGSFAKIDITQLKTFVGDVARVKVFRKSRNQVGDFQFVQESKLESSELLRDITTQNDTELSYGRFDESNLSTYWISSSNDHPLSIDSSILSQAVKIDYDSSVGGVQQLITSQSFNISQDVEYTLNFKTLLSGSLSDTGKSIRAFFSSSDFTQDFLTISGSAIYRTRQNISKNIISENTGNAKLVFEVKGDDWYISNASLKNAQETSFSPDEFTLIQDIPRKTASETFDFRFEFYDINNNYIPVDVTAVGVFDGGNDFPSSGKLLTFESDRNAFRFSSGSVQNPTGQQIQLKVSQNNLTGSVTFASSAFDVDGNYLNPSDYSQYPGKLTSVNSAGAIITINNFTGSRTDGLDTPFVGSVVYTASLENLEEFETVYRLEDGDNAPQLIVTSNANQFIYEPTTLSPKPSGQSITVRAQRKNLASLITPIEVNSGSNKPQLTYVDTVGGIDTYTISATAFSQSFAANNFDEVTYSFTGSDVFGNSQSDEITLSKVINFDAVSLVLSNESTSFPAKSTGEVTGGFAASSGSVQMFIGGNQITHIDGLTNQPNKFDIVSASGDGVTPTDDTPNTSNYSISDFPTVNDSGSLTLDIKYVAGDGITSQSFQKVVSYTKSKKAVPTVLTKVSPSTQTINSSSLGFETPQTMEVVVQEGGDEYTYDAALGSPNTFHINSLGYTAGSASFDDEIITLFTDSVGDGSGTFITSGLIGSASIDYKNSEGTPVYDKIVRFDLSVSKVGVDGVNGASGSDAKVVSLSSTKYAIVYDGDGNLFPASQPFTLSGSAQNFDDPRFQFLENGSQIQGFSTDSNVVIPTAGNLPTAGGTNLYEVRVKENGGSVEAFDNIDVFGVQSGSDAFTVFLTNEAHVFSATSESVVTSDLSDGSFEVRFFRGSQQYNSGSTGKTYSVSATTSNIVLSQSLESNNQAKFTPTSVSGDSGSAAITITDNNTSQTFNKQYSFTLSKEGINGQDGQDGEDGQDGADGANGVVINISPTSQTIKRSNSGTYDTPKIFTVTLTENGTLLTHQAGTGTPATSKYTITSLNNGTLSAGSGTTSPDITPTTPSALAGLTTTFNITYTDGKGTTSSALAQSHVVSVVLDGTTGPGIVHTGEWEAGRAYQYADGLSDGDGRIDTVLYSGVYYAATSQHTSTNDTNSSTGVPGSGPWESLGSQDLFVAAKIAIFEDSFIQNTLNIGTNNSGGVSSANITLQGANAYPYFSIGQSADTGSQGYAAGSGIFIGRDTDGSYKASFENSSTSYLKWTGTSLDIKGSITVTGGDAATQNQAQGYADTAESNAITAAETYANNVGENALLTGSIDSFELSLTSNMEIDGRKLRKTSGNLWDGEVRSGVSFTDGAVVSFKVENTASSRRFMMGLNSDPTTNTSHDSIDYHWYINGTTARERAGSGNAAGSANVTVTDGDYFTIVYDGTRILWYHNSTLTNTVSANAGQRFFLDSSFLDTTTLPICTWFTFGPDSPKNDSSKTDGTVGGWTIHSDKIFSGTDENVKDYTSAAGRLIISSSGAIHAPQFYVDASGNAKFKGALEAASGTFAGSLRVGSTDTSVSTVIDGADAGSTAAQPGDDISGFNNDSGYQDNNADKTGGSVGGWDITALAIKGGSPTSGGDGVFTNTGIIFGIDGSNDAYISSKRFYIDTDGNAKFSGIVSGSSIQGGTMQIGDNFTVDNDGNMTAQDATISGSFSIDGGTLGSWVVESPSDGGRLRNEYDVSAPGTGSLVFEPSIPEIQGYKIDGNAVEKKVSIHPENTWTSTTGGNQSAFNLKNNGSGGGGSWSLPLDATSDSLSTSQVYNSVTQTDGTGQGYTPNSSGIVVPQDGTYEISNLYGLSSLTMSTPSQISVTANYPTYSPPMPYFTHMPLASPRRHEFIINIVFTNISTSATTTVNLASYYNRGRYIRNGWQVDPSGTFWQSYTIDTAASTASNIGFTAISKTVTLTAGTYTAHYEVKNGAASGYTQNANASAPMSYGSINHFDTTNSVTSVGYVNGGFTVIIPSNLVELSSKGLQILNDTTNYIQLLRTDSVSGTPTVFTMRGGKMDIQAKNFNSGYQDIELLEVDGRITARALYVYSPVAAYTGGVMASLQPQSTYTLGSSTYRWGQIYSTNSTISTSDRREKTEISGSDLGLTFINELEPVKYQFSGSLSQSGRTHYGLIAQDVSESLSRVSKHTDDFAGYTVSETWTSGSDSGSVSNDKEDIIKDYGSLDGFTLKETKYGLRYEEFISPMIKAIQELSNKVTELENQISGSL